jgi:hypothetical protein
MWTTYIYSLYYVVGSSSQRNLHIPIPYIHLHIWLYVSQI